GVAQRGLVRTTSQRDQVAAEVPEAVIGAAVLDDVGGAPQLVGERPPVEALPDPLELRDLIRGEVAEALLEQVRLLVRVVSGVSPRGAHQLPEGGVVHSRGIGRGRWGRWGL